MLRGSSWVRHAGVTLVLLISLGAGSLSLPHAEAAFDADCNPGAVVHDESAHYIGADSMPGRADADHCFLCHSLRSFYQAFDRFAQHHYSPSAERLHLTPVHRACPVAWSLIPGRAPPA